MSGNWKSPHHQLRDVKLRRTFQSLEKYLARGGWSETQLWTPRLAAWDGSAAVDMDYGPNVVQSGRYWTRGTEVWFEAAVLLKNADSWDRPADGGGYIDGLVMLSVPLTRASEQDPFVGIDAFTVPMLIPIGNAEGINSSDETYGGSLTPMPYVPADADWDDDYRNWAHATDHYSGSAWVWNTYPPPLVPTADAVITWSGRYFTAA